MLLPLAICSTFVRSMPSVIPLSLQLTTLCAGDEQRAKPQKPSRLAVCSWPALTSLQLQTSPSSKSGSGRAAGSLASRNPQEMAQKQRGRGRTYCPHPGLIQIVTLQWCLHPTYVVLSSHLLRMKEQEEKKNIRLAYSWQGWEGKRRERKTPSAAAG